MTCSSPIQQQYANLTVLDVYDEAALIGKDIERIIEGNCLVVSIKINFIIQFDKRMERRSSAI